MTLSCTSTYLQDADTWEDKYCRQVEPCYKPDKDKDKSAGAATPSRRVPTQRRQLQARPIEHPLWRNKRGTEVCTGHCVQQLQTVPPWQACVSVGVSWRQLLACLLRCAAATPCCNNDVAVSSRQHHDLLQQHRVCSRACGVSTAHAAGVQAGAALSCWCQGPNFDAGLAC